jgi:hypothetical protein
MKGFSGVILLLIIVFLVVAAMFGYIVFIKPQNTKLSSTSYSQPVEPNIQVKDFAPNIPTSQKTTIIIQSSDSSEIKYIVPTNQVAMYVLHLPTGYHVISKSP